MIAQKRIRIIKKIRESSGTWRFVSLPPLISVPYQATYILTSSTTHVTLRESSASHRPLPVHGLPPTAQASTTAQALSMPSTQTKQHHPACPACNSAPLSHAKKTTQPDSPNWCYPHHRPTKNSMRRFNTSCPSMIRSP